MQGWMQMSRRTLTYALLVLWAGVYAWSFIAFQITKPTDFGFTAGLNRITTFLGWQFGAGLISIFALALSFEFAPRSLARWLVRLPFILAMLLLLVIIGIIAYARWGHPPPDSAGAPVNPPAVTKPVEPAQ